MANDKLWGGRFCAQTDEKTDDFNSSVRFDKRLYREDIEGSIAHTKMLEKQGIISFFFDYFCSKYPPKKRKQYYELSTHQQRGGSHF